MAERMKWWITMQETRVEIFYTYFDDIFSRLAKFRKKPTNDDERTVDSEISTQRFSKPRLGNS